MPRPKGKSHQKPKQRENRPFDWAQVAPLAIRLFGASHHSKTAAKFKQNEHAEKEKKREQHGRNRGFHECAAYSSITRRKTRQPSVMF
jgi:hypothetical protein